MSGHTIEDAEHAGRSIADMRIAKAAAVAAALVLMLVCAACNGGSGATEELDSAEAIVAKMMEAETTLETYTSEATVDGEFSINIPGEDAFSMEMEFSGTMDTVVNMLNQETAATMELEMTPAEGRPGRISMTMDSYLVDETMYYKLDSPIYSMGWAKVGMSDEYGDLSDESMSQMDMTQAQFDMLECADIDLVGSERVDGTYCYVLDVAPNSSVIWDLYMEMAESQPGMEGFSDPESMMETMWDDTVEKYTLRLWVAKDTLYPVKVEIAAAITMDEDTMVAMEEAMLSGLEEQSSEPEVSPTMSPAVSTELEFEGFYFHIDMSMTAFMRDYNQPVNIELPPGAEDAVDMSYYDGSIEGGW